MRVIDADEFERMMYHEAFENDASYDERNPMAKWESGLWIRYKMFENCLEKVPTIESKRGEWIALDENNDGYWKCSACKHPTEAFGAYLIYKYCPFCGADMRIKNNENN